MVSITKKELKDIKTLRTLKGRRDLGQFAAEGVRLLEQALQHNVMPRLLLATRAEMTERGEELIRRFRAKRVPMVEISARESRSVCDAVTSQGLLGVFDLPENPATKLLSTQYRKVLLCDGISDPGNLGAIIRCALAFGFNPLLLVGNCADPFAPKVVRSSAGAIFGLKLVRATASEVVRLSAEGKFSLVAADLKGKLAAKAPVNTKRDKVILAVGSEAEGLSDDIVQEANYRWRLKHESSVESLNAAVAAAIMMKQFYDQAEG
jgi:TrmH family RNA methyltransferase